MNLSPITYEDILTQEDSLNREKTPSGGHFYLCITLNINKMHY